MQVDPAIIQMFQLRGVSWVRARRTGNMLKPVILLLHPFSPKKSCSSKKEGKLQKKWDTVSENCLFPRGWTLSFGVCCTFFNWPLETLARILWMHSDSALARPCAGLSKISCSRLGVCFCLVLGLALNNNAVTLLCTTLYSLTSLNCSAGWPVRVWNQGRLRSGLNPYYPA